MHSFFDKPQELQPLHSTPFRCLIIALFLLFGSLNTQAKELPHSYLSCALITSEHLTTLQLYQRGIPKDLAIDSLPNISRKARQRVDYVYGFAKKVGILNAYTDINTNFSRCSTLVHKQKGIPAKDLKEYGYYFCSGENKIRFELILYIDQGFSDEKIKSLVPKKHHNLIPQYRRVINGQGNLAAFDLMANNLKACLHQIE